MTIDQIKAGFAVARVPYTGGLFLLEAPSAIALVRRAAEERIPILGVNCLITSQHESCEPIDQIADYSAAVRSGYGCWEEAERHIAHRAADGYVFEVVLGDNPVQAI